MSEFPQDADDITKIAWFHAEAATVRYWANRAACDFERKTLLKIASDYDRMAEKVEMRAQISDADFKSSQTPSTRGRQRQLTS